MHRDDGQDLVQVQCSLPGMKGDHQGQAPRTPKQYGVSLAMEDLWDYGCVGFVLPVWDPYFTKVAFIEQFKNPQKEKHKNHFILRSPVLAFFNA